MAAVPPAALLPFYKDTLYFDKRGRLTKSSPRFEGLPYRYGVDQAAHVWFPVQKGLQKRLRGSGGGGGGGKKVGYHKRKGKRLPKQQQGSAGLVQHRRETVFWPKPEVTSSSCLTNSSFSKTDTETKPE